MQNLNEQQLRVRLVQPREEKTLTFLQLTLFLGEEVMGTGLQEVKLMREEVETCGRVAERHQK